MHGRKLVEYLHRESAKTGKGKSILVPRASWGPEHQQQEALGKHDLKS